MRQFAENTRGALSLLGYPVTPACLPGEPDACGATDTEHALANLFALQAVIEHHMSHFTCTDGYHLIYVEIAAELAAGCSRH